MKRLIQIGLVFILVIDSLSLIYTKEPAAPPTCGWQQPFGDDVFRGCLGYHEMEHKYANVLPG